jgi:hypothetical protein
VDNDDCRRMMRHEILSPWLAPWSTPPALVRTLAASATGVVAGGIRRQ